MSTAPEQVTDVVTEHGEGPCWWPGWGGLRWVDLLAGDLLTLEADGTVRRRHVGRVAAFVRPRRRGGYVVALERGIALADDPDGDPTPMPELWADPAVRMNDGGCDTDGSLWAGTMAYEGTEGAGTLFRIDPAGHAEVVLAGVTISNGIDVSADGARVFYNDSGVGTTDVLDRVGTRLERRRTVFRPDEGAPDGLTVY